MKTLLRITLGFLLVVFAVPSWAAGPVHLWSQRFGGASFESGYGVAMDAAGNVVVTGYFAGTVDFGGGPLVSAGVNDIFVAKYNASGVHQWSRRFGGTSADLGYAVAIDGSGNVVVTGAFDGTANFGGGNLVSAGDYDVFVAKYNSSGVHQWSERFGGTGVDIGLAVAVDGLGNGVVTGYFEDTADFGGGPLVSAGSEDIFVAKYDGGGAHQWSKRIGAASEDLGLGVAADGAGNVVVTGEFNGTVNFGGGNLVSAGYYDIFLAKYDASGAHQWSQRYGSAGYETGYGLALDGSGNVVVTGGFTGTVDLGGGNLVSAGSLDMFIAKYDASGAHQWSERFGGTGDEFGYALAVDGLGNVVVTGTFQGTADLGGGNLVSAGQSDIFVAKYDASGAHQWSQGFGSPGFDEGDAVAVDGSGNVVVTGNYQGTMDFGGGPLVSAGSNDIFLAKFAGQSPLPVLISRFDATPRQGGVELAWEFSSDEALDGFTIYRGQAQSSPVVIASGDARTTRSYTDASVEPGTTYQYTLVIRTAGGDEFRSPMATASMPRALTTLAQNFPNPFNPRTTIAYTVGTRAPITIEIFDASGILVRRLDEGVREAGSYSVEWDGRDAANRSVGSGVYFYRFSGVKGAETRKMVLLK